MDYRYLAAFGCFNQLAKRAGIRVGDIGLFLGIVGEHPRVDVCAFVACGAPGCLDIRLVAVVFGGGFDDRGDNGGFGFRCSDGFGLWNFSRWGLRGSFG